MSSPPGPSAPAAPLTPEGARVVCYRCHKPQVACVCASIVPVDNRTAIHVLQHKRERFHPIGTARFAELGLARGRVIVDDPQDRAGTTRDVQAGEAPLGVLFPSPRARLLSALAPDERPRTLIVVDGTWPQARSLMRLHTWLHALPHYALAPAHKSLYRIRTEPFDTAISTIEAIVLALRTLEPELTGLDALLEAFVGMIDKQIELGSTKVGRVRKKRPPQPSRAYPEVLFGPRARWVVVFGELVPSSGRTVATAERSLLSWCALRVASGESFAQVIRPAATPTPAQLAHMGLEAEHLAQGTTAEAARAAWRAWLRPDDVLVAWNQSTVDAARATLGPEFAPLMLKAVYANGRKQREAAGSLAEIAAEEGLEVHPAPPRGRAGVVLGQLAALLELVHTRALAHGRVEARRPAAEPPGGLA